jgi:CubicO group peptidase (beta-lactamase class C family)
MKAAALALMTLLVGGAAFAADLPPETQSSIDAIVTKALAVGETPSASIAIVRDGQIEFAKAYGSARLEPAMPATPDMRYKIASNSKQLTATAILLLAEQHKLSLDDKVARFLPDLTRAKDITLRELLTHSSGYSDYYAPDYLPLYMKGKVTPGEILDHFAKTPLDFEPGSRWQYSNTGYVALGQVVEKVSGQSLMAFLRQRVFSKLGMKSPIDIDHERLGDSDPLGYTHYALGPMRPVEPEGPGWMSAAGELAMTASDLSRWDISLMEGTILKPASTKALTTEMQLSDGTASNYGLGIRVSQMANGHRRWVHTGGASGFLSINVMFPDDGTAITILTNGDGLAYRTIEKDIETLLFSGQVDRDEGPSLERAKQLYGDLRQGKVDRASLTEDLSDYFSAGVLADFGASLGPLGQPESFEQSSREDRGGMVHRVFTIKAGGKTVRMETYIMPDGKFEQCLIRQAE